MLQTKCSAAKPDRIRHKLYRIPELVPLHDICFQKWKSTACSNMHVISRKLRKEWRKFGLKSLYTQFS